MRRLSERPWQVDGSATVYVVLPGDVDDPTAVSGGNNYDRQVCHGLVGSGWRLTELAVDAAWVTLPLLTI